MQPGLSLAVWGAVVNRTSGDLGPFWIEVWGSRTRGLTLDGFLIDSLPVNALAGGAQYDFSVNSPAYAVPDGPYTVVVTANRPVAANYGRRAIGEAKLLMIRPQTQANLKIEGFAMGSATLLTRGNPATLAGTVRNAGSAAAGPFWIEFWASTNQQYPSLDWFLCDSIFVNGLAPGAVINLATYARNLYGTIPTGPCAVGCFVDRTDMVNETDETDNYTFIPGYQVY
jgi:hypothetical protein